jgi:hypothetical protein
MRNEIIERMLRKKLGKVNIWKALILAGLITGYAAYGFRAQSKLQKEQVSGTKSETNMGKGETGGSKEPGILLRSIFNLLDF